MGSAALSLEAQSFLDDNVESVEEVEILLLLRSEPKRDFDAIEVGHHIGLEPISASGRLLKLHKTGLLDHPAEAGRFNRFRHRLGTLNVEKCLDELAMVFAKSRMEVVAHLAKKQRNQLRFFADAFRVRRDPTDG